MPHEVAQLTLSQFYYFKNIAWYNKCSTSQIDYKVYDKLLDSPNYSSRKYKEDKKLLDGQERALKDITADGKKPTIKLIREYMSRY